MKAQRCPVCNGAGVVRVELDERVASVDSMTVTCHGCSGKGWIEVSEVDECVVVPRQEEHKADEGKGDSEQQED